MAGMQRAIGVARWHDDAKVFVFAWRALGDRNIIGIKKTTILPEFVYSRFGLPRVIRLQEFAIHGHRVSKKT